MKYSIFNVIDNVDLGIFTEAEFVHRVRQIAVENDDEELSITCIGEAKDYLREYCPNLEFGKVVEDNVVSVNILELASELAHERTLGESQDICDSEDDMYDEDTEGCFVYKEEIQDRFNLWYDYFYSKIVEIAK